MAGRKKPFWKKVKDNRTLLLMCLPAVVFFIVFNYCPLPGVYLSLIHILLNSGMITIVKRLDPGYYQIRIPNKEVRSAFIGLTEYALQIQEGSFSNLFGALRQVHKG